jgi:N utilization substance protein A
LAGKLTGYEIDVYRENDEFDEDVDIEEFSDEIESWVIDELKRVGLDAKVGVVS